MYALLLSAMLIGVLTPGQAADVQRSETVRGAGVSPAEDAAQMAATRGATRPEPCYVVIAIDVSGDMEGSDGPSVDSAGRRQTLRDQGQLLFLQLLPFLYSDLYVGVTHFSDRVRYSLPSEDTGPLLPWGQTFLNESACRNLVKPAEFQASFRTDIAAGMNWASAHIQAARRQYGQGPAKLIVLTDGDPRDGASQSDRIRSPLLNLAKRLAEQQIQVYPILIDAASFRSGEGQPRLSGRELATGDLMDSVASTTGGRAYRLSRELGFADILMDAFGLVAQERDGLVVSQHDWAIIAAGALPASMTIEPSIRGAGAQTVALNNSIETVSGIRPSVISSSWHQATVLRRPESRELVDRFWQGRWKLGSADEKSPATVRIYRIPDFLMRLELEPQLPWWLHEQVQLRVHVLDRHKGPSGPQSATSAVAGQGLSIHVKANPAEEKNAFLVDKGRWITPGQLFETESFVVGAPGLYKLTCELRHRVGDANAPVLQLVSDVYVHSECVGMEIVSAATKGVLQEVPQTAAKLQIDSQGGQDVYFRIRGKGEFKVEPLSGVVGLEPLSPTQWSLRKEEGGNLVAGPVRLPERDERLTGWADVDVRTPAGIRHIRLPRFEMSYTPAPVRVECTFADSRDALWVGEFHKQLLTVSAFPVFDRLLDKTLQVFPEALAGARIRTIDTRSGMTQAMGPDSRVLERPQPGGYEGRTVTATYFVESAIPIPAADKCEIDLGGTVEGLQGALKTYAVVDPVAKGLFEWRVQQGPSDEQQGPVAGTLFAGEPIRFFAGWRPDQNVSAVRFEILGPSPAEPVFVDMPVVSGTNKVQLEQAVPSLASGQTLPIYVHVTMQLAGADRTVQIKLKGGQFRAEDRRVVLEDLTVGDGTPTDIPAYAWEPVEVPLRVTFSGYKADDLQHNAAIEQFKRSCVVTATSRAGDVRNVSDTIEWTSVTPEGATKKCRLVGRARYTPEVSGRAAVELSAEAPTAKGPSLQRAYAHVLAREPRLTVAVYRLKPGGEEPVFDSRKWVTGQGGASVLATRLSVRLRVDVQSGDWTAGGQPQPWKTTMRLLRRSAPNADWVTESSEVSELAPNSAFSREVQIAENGQYAVEIVGQDAQSSRRTAYVLTPVIASVQSHEVKPTIAPPVWLTSRVRQWPFEYQVTLHQDSVDSSGSQALAFQFQLPGQQEAWLDGATSPVRSDAPDTRQLAVRGPRLLPALEGLRDGVARFKLSSQGLELLRWECPNIRVIPAVLEKLVLSRQSAGGTVEPTDATLVSDGSADLWVRPLFRTSPELEGQWAPSETIIYVWRNDDAGPAGGQVDARVLDRLQEYGKGTDRAGGPRTGAAGSRLQTFRIANNMMSGAVKALPGRPRWGLWGWPRAGVSERYSLVASVIYRPLTEDRGQRAEDRAHETAPSSVVSPPSSGSGDPPADRMIAEWSDVYAIDLNRPWAVPLCWWPVAAVLLVAGFVAVLRVVVPSPGRLALDMRLDENVAIVEPVRLDNPVLVDLRETSLAREVRLYSRYLRHRWGAAATNSAKEGGRRPASGLGAALGGMVAAVVAPVRVLLRRAVFPRRWAWAVVEPRIRGNGQPVRAGLLCVWTGLGTRRGRVWSSQVGSLDLPEEGQTKAINLDFPYQIDGVDRTMRVTVRVRRMARESIDTGWRRTDSEYSV